MIRTTFWGVRGSVPVPGTRTSVIGGNTACVELLCGDTRLIMDGGTGLRELGNHLAGETPLTLHLLFSHVHWDHIQGFPFFVPVFTPGNTVHLYGATHVYGSVEAAMAGQMQAPNFPVRLDDLPSQLVFHDLKAGETLELEGGRVRLTTAAGNHPGGVLSYRVEYEDSVVVYATDTEHGDAVDERLVELARGADLLIHDAQYTPEEYRGDDGRPRVGWGHSTFVQAARVAQAAGVKRYVLFHHDPDQNDAAVRDKERRARELFADSVAAYEGLTLEV